MRVVLDTNILVSALISRVGATDRLYSAWKDGRFVLVTSNEQLEEFRRVTRYARVKPLIEPGAAGTLYNQLRTSEAVLETLPTVTGAPFDLVFIDADKENNPGYLEWAVKLTRPGSVVLVDNVIREGAILSSDPDAVVQGTRRALEILGEHPQLDTAVIQTVGAKHWDGFAIALVK